MKRYIITLMKADRRVPARYRQRGYMAFDTLHIQHGPVRETKKEAQADADRYERQTKINRSR